MMAGLPLFALLIQYLISLIIGMIVGMFSPITCEIQSDLSVLAFRSRSNRIQSDSDSLLLLRMHKLTR